MIIEPKESFIVQYSLVQFRISSMNSSGLTNIINESSVTFVISQCKLAGSNLIQSSSNGYIASAILVKISLNITQFDICVDSTSRFGQNSVSISIIGSETVECDLCDQQSVVYGLCGLAIQYSEIVNGMYQCVHPFEYVNNQCVCATGYLINNTKCINVVQSLNAISNLISNSSNDQIKLLEQKVDSIETSLVIVDQSISSNISELENRILSNYSKSDNNLILNTSVLDDRIYQNITSVKNDILMKYISADANLFSNTTVLDWRIFNNASQLQNNINNFTIYYNESLLKLAQLIEQQQNIINNLTQQINCSSNSGYQMVNGSCVQVSCAITGQQRINGICQCTNINAYISGSQCVCPMFSSLVGNTCTCPSNSQIVNNICTCNVITGQVMSNGVCQCQTIGAFADNGACTCGLNALNESDTCTCPTNSSLINNVCTCDKISGQIIVNGACLCPMGQSVVDETCIYVVKTSNFECSLPVFTQQFDVISISHQITASGNFSAGYVFSAATTIQNAFVDISDNVYSTTVYPLFQSQSTFANLKIQFGTQTFNSGSLLLPSSSVSINQMNIISRPGSQLTVNSAQVLNILIESLSSTNITNLLVNLSFAPSNGNITLINNINGVFNVSGYQILGAYISTGSVAMIGLKIDSATVNVNKVSFKPTAFNVGTGSSYLFGNVTMMSTIQINNIAVIIGSISNFLLLGSISTTTLNKYQFGGIIAQIQYNSIVNVNNVILDSYQHFSTDYVYASGFLLGQILWASNITIQNVCLQQNMTSTTSEFNTFGLIGQNININSSVRHISVAFAVQGTKFQSVGIIGSQDSGSIYVEVLSARASVSVSSGNGSINIGSIFGAILAKNCSVQNTSVAESINSGSDRVGGFVGIQFQNLTIMNSSIQQTNISGTSNVGGFVGESCGHLYLTNSRIQAVRLSGDSNVGIVTGSVASSAYYTYIYAYTSSSSAQVYVNEVLRGDCAAISNRDGC
ncbi:Conserved_hypothetical protein [Hexamita inflata]|uniref:Uncharacterized protein n=1 Tax=Hexamita inflata TaxID=28002 RepID=A0AA86REI6_9EUKA|nr:Conserved hypothetical protein [Hexamita inflata]